MPKTFPPKVTVCVLTYNQEEYIGQCLQSIVDQETSFDFEVIVGDDCSTDGTKAIVQRFTDKYPSLVKALYQEKNTGGAENYLAIHNLAQSEYIAHVDGDDYCLPGKLQAQADFLDRNPNCNIVWHRMLVDLAGVTHEGWLQIDNLEDLELDRAVLIQFMTIGAHSSKMYRKSVREIELPDFVVTDYYVNIEQVRNGVGRFVGPAYYGVYRMGVGIASSGNRTRKMLARTLGFLYKRYPQHRLEVNTAALVCLIGDIKNRRGTWKNYLWVWIKTFHAGSLFNLIRSLDFLKKTTFKKGLTKNDSSSNST